LKVKVIKKKDLDKALVEERKKMRSKQQESKFKSRTLNIYKGQVARAKNLEMCIDYNIEEFREFTQKALLGQCPYCGGKLTVTNFVADHKDPISRGGLFTLDNLAICDKSCNFRKGCLSNQEYTWFNKAIVENLSSESVEDVRRRLTAGGKWSPR